MTKRNILFSPHLYMHFHCTRIYFHNFHLQERLEVEKRIKLRNGKKYLKNCQERLDDSLNLNYVRVITNFRRQIALRPLGACLCRLVHCYENCGFEDLRHRKSWENMFLQEQRRTNVRRFELEQTLLVLSRDKTSFHQITSVFPII